MLRADIIQAVGDMFTTETLEEERLKRLITMAVKYYSRYNPFQKDGTITLAVNQQDYDVDVTCVVIRSVDYWPAGDLGDMMRSGQEYTELIGDEVRAQFPSDRVIRNIERTSRADRQGRRWEPLGSRKVRLHPAPTAVDTIDYQYYAVHALTGVDYTTIPAEDLELVRDLTLAEIIQGRGLEYAVEPDYAEGLQRVTKHYIPGNVRATVAGLRQGVRSKYGSGAVADQGSIA